MPTTFCSIRGLVVGLWRVGSEDEKTMRSTSWVDLNANFGDPYKVFVIDLRTAMSAGFGAGMNFGYDNNSTKLEAECL